MSDEWVYRERYDRLIEGLEPPVWVLVVPDNVAGAGYSWDASPPPGRPTKSYEIRNGAVVPTADTAGSEPTNDLYSTWWWRLVRTGVSSARSPSELWHRTASCSVTGY